MMNGDPTELRDFTLDDARWVVQEFDKHTTAESIACRIRNEENFSEITKNDHLMFPNSRLAHLELIKRLKAKLADIEIPL